MMTRAWGQQGVLSALLVRLGQEHPHHVLAHVLALRNGDRGKDGRHVRPGSARQDVMKHHVDYGKLEAAKSVLEHVAADPSRYAVGVCEP